ncbi:MAG TPA: polymer-forming cytoskeletal protein [Cyclobacteriaceae bacterium]|nr:polymer-forming cytoskeletal protein [Cyclobacteriaceae bacterium]
MFNNKNQKFTEEELSNSSNIIGKGTTVEGGIDTFGNIRVEGRIIGNVKSKSKVALGHSSYVEGDIVAQNAEIAGEVSGKIEVAELLIIKPSGVIKGDITTGKLIIESGAAFNGSCRMGVYNQSSPAGGNGIPKEAFAGKV